jgi:hypothetical protein
MKKIALASAILLHLHCYKAQDTIHTRNLQADLAMIHPDNALQEKKPFFKRNG